MNQNIYSVISTAAPKLIGGLLIPPCVFWSVALARCISSAGDWHRLDVANDRYLLGLYVPNIICYRLQPSVDGGERLDHYLVEFGLIAGKRSRWVGFGPSRPRCNCFVGPGTSSVLGPGWFLGSHRILQSTFAYPDSIANVPDLRAMQNLRRRSVYQSGRLAMPAMRPLFLSPVATAPGQRILGLLRAVQRPHRPSPSRSSPSRSVVEPPVALQAVQPRRKRRR